MTATELIYLLFDGILIYFLLLASWYVALMVLAFPEVVKGFKEASYGNIHNLIDQEKLVPITVVMPAYNEQKRILNAIYSVLNSDYKNIEIIVVNDGSIDNTMSLLIQEFSLYAVPYVNKQGIETAPILKSYQSDRYPNLRVLDKEHYSLNCASDAVNAGLNECRTPIIVTLDSDTVLEPDALSKALFTLLSQKHCVAVGGTVFVLNGSVVQKGKILDTNMKKPLVPAIQSVGYLRSFLYGRAGCNLFKGALCYPGAFTLFDTAALREVGGIDRANNAYDTEIIMRLHHWMKKNKRPYCLKLSTLSFAWTEVPGTLRSFLHQQDLWQRGMLRSTFMHKAMFLNFNYGLTGIIGFPCYIFFEVFGPVVEFFTLLLSVIAISMGLASLASIFWFIVLAWGFIAVLSLAMIFLNMISFNKYHNPGDIFRVLKLVFLEMLGFRQLRAGRAFIASFKYMFNRLRGKPL